MLSMRINNIGLVFSVQINGYYIQFIEWNKTDDCIYYYPLATLVDNGNAMLDQNECIVPFENIYLLDNNERFILGIPPYYDKKLRLRGIGMLNYSDFSYKLELLTSVPDGEILLFEREKNIVFCSFNKFLLSESQYSLFIAVEDYNNTNESEKTIDFNLRLFAKIKMLAKQANCCLDSYLENENVFVPDKIKIEITQDDIGYKVFPSVDIAEKDQFISTFDKMRRVTSVYPIQRETGERIRVVLNKEQKDDLELLKQHKCRYKSKNEIKELISNPTEYFDPNQFDLSEFYSDRVIEIGLYKPKFYPFVCSYKSCWIAGATIESPENGTSKITLNNMELLLELENLINDALEKNTTLINYKEVLIDVSDAIYLANIARKQLASPNIPIQQEDNNKECNVLLIKENTEDLCFETDKYIIERGDKFTMFKNSYLKENFQLKTHQEEGIAWLQHLYANKASGCLMADDMGLGKTLQVLYFIDWHSRKYPNHKPYLIVAPISLLENWENEYKRFFGEPRLEISRLTSKDIPRRFNKNIIGEIQKKDIVLTNYESLRVSQLNFCAVQFEVVVLDEAQKIKSLGTLVTNAAKALKSNFKIAMTGTPVENSLLDLWCIMDFCVPGLLDNAKAFASQYQLPLKKQDHDIIAFGNELHAKLGIFFMRRLKQDVAKDLPHKFELKEFVEMPALQESKYITAVTKYMKGIEPDMLTTIMNIREISEHPYLHDSTLSQYETDNLIETSARLIATISFLDKIKTMDEKVILFAERKDIQKMLQKIAWERYCIAAKIINGDTPLITSNRGNINKKSRQVSIDEFQVTDGFNIIIMSPIAAGMGLNITGANHVIHYSRHWNPAKEHQATDRAYRIGQTKDVYVYYPMAISNKFKAFDINLDDLLSRKMFLAASTIFPTDRIEVTKDELGEMMFEN